jgi:outer membrane protein assembly factor BamD (BamD/ComL family)
LLLLVLCEVSAQPVMAEEGADLLWNFANYLYQEEYFYRAATEYNRFIFRFPSDSRALEAELQIGRCYRHGGKPEKAVNYLVRLIRRGVGEPVTREAILEVVAIREEQKRFPEAIYWTKRFTARYSDESEIDSAYLRLAWLQVEDGKYEQALATLQQISPESRLHSRARSLSQALEQRPEGDRKSPAVAGALSAVLPGSGHLYAGRPGEAATSFFLNALFITGAVVAFKNDSPVLGGILVFFELGWYVGGIRTAVKAAREANVEEEKRFRQELKETYRLSLGLEPGLDRLGLSLRLSF